MFIAKYVSPRVAIIIRKTSVLISKIFILIPERRKKWIAGIYFMIYYVTVYFLLY